MNNGVELKAGAQKGTGVKVFEGDCLNMITAGQVETQSVDLIFTSPPYADQRKKSYGGVHPDQYFGWFLPRALELKRCLKPTGSFILNIKEKALNGERHTYVIQLILALQASGWLWVEEYCWHKKTAYPGKWPNRFRDSWERLLHFTVNKHWDNVYPSNVVHMSPEVKYRQHPAPFPVSLPDWFIRLFTDQGDTVLDPFAGAGSTLIAASTLQRKAIGVDISSNYCALMRERLLAGPPSNPLESENEASQLQLPYNVAAVINQSDERNT